ncbi:lysostaphin resistance A-like protein [Falsibacillus pallidus]|uniref:CPBP family intramembrane glutamic endopeptidase n=1 Tax=Falsibacillus pallidus TaxID=493781 RepID=UPI003D972221
MIKNSSSYDSFKWRHLVWGIIFTFLLVPIASSLLTEILFASGKGILPGTDGLSGYALDRLQTAVISFFQMLGACLFLLFYGPMKRLVRPVLSLKPLRMKKTYLLLIILMIATYLFGFLVDFFFPSSAKDQLNELSLARVWDMHPGLIVLTFLATSLFVPIYEEFIFRGVILTFFRSKYSYLTSSVLSSLLFGIAHFYSLGVVISAFFAGLLLSYLCKKSGSITPGIVFHMLNNAAALLLSQYL